MKNILLALFMLVTSFSFGQSNQMVEYTQQQPVTQVYVDWQLSNQGCLGCASFYWKVNRTPLANGWQFDIWWYSNSFYENGVRASTYVSGILVNVDGYLLRKDPVWILFKDQYSNQLTSFVSMNSNPKIYITWGAITIY